METEARAGERACVFYEAESGSVLHVHLEVTLPGAEAPDDAEFEDQGRQFAVRATEHDPETMAALVVAGDSLRAALPTAVDRERRELVWDAGDQAASAL